MSFLKDKLVFHKATGIIIIAALFLSCQSTHKKTVEIKKAALLSAKFLTHWQDQSGKFPIKINLDSKSNNGNTYNILWHLSSIEILCKLYNENPKVYLVKGIAKSAKFIKEHALLPLPGDSALGIWSKKEIVNIPSQNDRIKLGTLGVGLAALLEVNKLKPGFTPDKELEKIAAAIEDFTRANGAVYGFYYPNQTPQFDSNTPDTYPAIAAYGLLKFGEYSNNPKWTLLAYKILVYYSNKYNKEAPNEIIPWFTRAYSLLKELNEKQNLILDLSTIYSHAKNMAEEAISRQNLDIKESAYYGSFNPKGFSAINAAITTELIHCYSLFKNDKPFANQILKAVEAGISFLNKVQIKEGESAGAIPKAALRIPGAPSLFNLKQTEVRMDIVTHSINAFHGYYKILLSEEG